jgi:hypothetical protein
MLKELPRGASEQHAYEELCAYTLELAQRHGSFIHQHVVDAYAAQNAQPGSRTMSVAFALIGLQLFVERGYTGKEIQRVHIVLAQENYDWPAFDLPANRGAWHAGDVMLASPGAQREAAIGAWCASVWHAYAGARHRVIEMLVHHGIA